MSKRPSKPLIAFCQYTNPAAYPPLEHLSVVLAQRGARILFLGSGAQGDASGFKLGGTANVEARILPFCPPGLLQKLHFAYFALWVFIHLLLRGPCWIYASDPLGCPAALLSSLIPGRRIIYHEHDSPTEYRSGLIARLLAWTRRQVYRRAKLVVVPSEGRRRHLLETLGPHPELTTVFNCPLKSEIKPTTRTPSRAFTVFYHGSLNLQRLPLTIVQSLSLLPSNVRLQYAGYLSDPRSTFHEEVRNEARRMGVENRVEYLGSPAKRSELLALACTADVGIALMPAASNDINMRTMAGASNKAFDYLACGLGLVVSDLPDWADLYVSRGVAQSCNPANPESIASAISWFIDHPNEWNRQRCDTNNLLRNQWNYELQSAPVIRAIIGEDAARAGEPQE